MIKVGILGAETKEAGDLIRLLLHHPEVDLISVFAPSFRGQSLSSVHRGLVGETEMRFSDQVNLEELDVVFVSRPSSILPLLPPVKELPQDLRVILLDSEKAGDLPEPFNSREYVPAVSEMFRKPLVRGASASRNLPSPVSVALIVLFPLALHLLLNDDLKIRVLLPEYQSDAYQVSDMKGMLEDILHSTQLSFTRIESMEVNSSKAMRALSVEAEFPCAVSESEIERIYEEMYDDHNFTFLVKTDAQPTEVAGTQKCLISISKPTEGSIRIKGVADAVMRGGAGDAIHAMNLLFGLFEKTGLSLPAALAYNHEDHEQNISQTPDDGCK